MLLAFLQHQSAKLPHLVYAPHQSPLLLLIGVSLSKIGGKQKAKKWKAELEASLVCLSKNKTSLALSFIFPDPSSTSGRQSPLSLLIKGSRRGFCLHCINIQLGRIFSVGKKVFPKRTESLRGLARCIVLIWLLRVMKSKQTFINKPFHTSSALSS